MKKFTFTNISNQLKISEVAKINNPKPNIKINPVLEVLNDTSINMHYTDSLLKIGPLNGVPYKLVLYSGDYITLQPSESITVEASNEEMEQFYFNIAAVEDNYGVVDIKIEDDPKYETWKDLEKQTWYYFLTENYTWESLYSN